MLVIASSLTNRLSSAWNFSMSHHINIMSEARPWNTLVTSAREIPSVLHVDKDDTRPVT
jgi:hypothetical protein